MSSILHDKESHDKARLETALHQMEVTALNFAQRFINDGPVRMEYIRQTKKLSKEYRAKVNAGSMTVREAARQAQEIRNQILDTQRLRSSDIGRAVAENLKKRGKTLPELMEKYAQEKFGKPFKTLSIENQNKVYLEIINSAGRPAPKVSSAASKFSKLGRSLLVVTVGIAVYNITTAEDKLEATAKEGVVLGAGFLGSAGGGMLAGLACGPGAPVCMAIGVFLGGSLTALGADYAFEWYF